MKCLVLSKFEHTVVDNEEYCKLLDIDYNLNREFKLKIANAKRALAMTNQIVDRIDFNALEGEKDIINTIKMVNAVINTSSIISDTSFTNAYISTLNAMDRVSLHEVTSMIAHMTHDIVTKMQLRFREKGYNLSREQIIKGNFKTSSGTFSGLPAIYKAVFKKLLNQVIYAYNNATTEEEKQFIIDKYNKIINNKAAIVVLSQADLSIIEGFNIHNTNKTTSFGDNIIYGENDISELYIAEESPREHWQEMADLKDSFTTLNKEVKKVLSTIPTGEVNMFGYPVYASPLEVYRKLANILVGKHSISSMIEAIHKVQETDPIYAHILEALNAEGKENAGVIHAFRTRFCNSFRKTFKPYSIIFSRGKEIVSKVINKSPTHNFSSAIIHSMFLHQVTDPEFNIYDNTGHINISKDSNFQKFKTLLSKKDNQETLISDREEMQEALKSKTAVQLNVGKIDRLRHAFEALGISIQASDVANLILYNGDKYIEIINNFVAISNYGFKQLKQDSSITLRDLYYQDKSTLKSNLDNIFRILSVAVSGRMSAVARYRDKHGKNIIRHSIVQPSYLGNEIENFKEAQNHGSVQSYIQEKYLKSSFFGSENDIKCTWLKDLYNENDDDALLNFFSFQNFLGYTTPNGPIPFENMSKGDHALAMLTNYWEYRQIHSQYNILLTKEEFEDIRKDYVKYSAKINSNNTNTYYQVKETGKVYVMKEGQFQEVDTRKLSRANYSTFILGDSNVSEYITSRVYTINDIREGLYNAVFQEIEHMKKIKAANQKLQQDGFTGKSLFVDCNNRWIMCPFMKEFTDIDISDSKTYPTKAQILSAIDKYMDKKFNDYLKLLTQEHIIEEVIQDDQVIDYKSSYFETDINNNIKVGNTFKNMLLDYYWNNYFATLNQLQMMTITANWYESIEDLQKRYKQIHSPGDMLDLEARDYTGKLYSESGNQTVLYFEDVNYEANPEFIAALEAVDPELAKAYKKNTVTDGQGYRTLKSYRAVMGMAGKWTQEMQKVYDEIEKIPLDREPTAEELASLERAAIIFQPIKPQYYGFESFQISKDNAMLIPVQHKYAEQILIPQLLPHGSMLKDLAITMMNKGVDLACSTKCVKVGSFGQCDISKVENIQELADNVNKSYKHVLSYAGYKLQSNVPEHVHESRLAGTQSRKVSMSNLNRNKEYNYLPTINGKNIPALYSGKSISKMTGTNIMDFYNKLLGANILDSFNTFKDEISDIDKLSEQLIRNALVNKSGEERLMAYTLTAYLDGTNKISKDFLLQLFDPSIEFDAGAYILSLFKKEVNKQKMSGGSAVQVSCMGQNGYHKDSNLKVVCYEGNPLYSQIGLSWSNSYYDINGKEHKLEFNKYCNPDGTLKCTRNVRITKDDPRYREYLSWQNDDGTVTIPDIELTFPGILDIIAYRIPTERNYSIMNCKVVRFYPLTMGGIVSVPAYGTTCAGFDFDIDKLYFLRKQFDDITDAKSWALTHPELTPEEILEYERTYHFDDYNYDKYPSQNSRTARNNMLFHLMRARLMDKETITDRYTPGGFESMKEAGKIIRYLNLNAKNINHKSDDILGDIESKIDEKESYNVEYDACDPATILAYNKANQIAGKLIGIFANQNANHALSSLLSTFKVKNNLNIDFGNHVNGNHLDDLLHNIDGVNTDMNMAALLASSVDAVKDNALLAMNLNETTANVGCLLARLGYSMKEISALLNQPAIKQLCEIQQLSTNTMSVDLNIQSMLANQYKSIRDYDPKRYLNTNVLMRNLVYNQVGVSTVDYAESQSQVLMLFRTLNKIASDLNEFVNATKATSANFISSTFGGMQSTLSSVSEFVQKYNTKDYSFVIGTNEVISNIDPSEADLICPIQDVDKYDAEYGRKLLGNPLAYEQIMIDACKSMMKLLNDIYLPYNQKGYQEAEKRLLNLTSKSRLPEKVINFHHVEFLDYLLSNIESSPFNGNNVLENGKTLKEYFTSDSEGFIKDLLEEYQRSVNDPVALENTRLKLLNTLGLTLDRRTNPTTKETKIIICPMKNLHAADKARLRDQWATVYRENPAIIRDLYFYNYYNYGFTYGIDSFLKKIPEEFIASIMLYGYSGATNVRDFTTSINYASFLKGVKEGRYGQQLSAQFTDDYAKKFVLNHAKDYTFKKNLKYSQLMERVKSGKIDLSYNKNEKKHTAETLESFTVDFTPNKDSEDAYNLFLKKITTKMQITDEDPIIYVSPLLEIDGNLFIASGKEEFNKVVDNTITYIKTSNLGVDNVETHYDSFGEIIDDAMKDNYENIGFSDVIINDNAWRGFYSEYYRFLKRKSLKLGLMSELDKILEMNEDSDEEVKDDEGNTICK